MTIITMTMIYMTTIDMTIIAMDAISDFSWTPPPFRKSDFWFLGMPVIESPR